MAASVIESKRTIVELILTTSLKLSFGSLLAGRLMVSDVSGNVSWQDVMPKTTKTVFYQAATPDGWTVDVSANGAFFSVVNSAGGGGVQGSFAGFSITTSESDHTHPITSHTHPMTASWVDYCHTSAGAAGQWLRIREITATGWTSNYNANGGSGSTGAFVCSVGAHCYGNTNSQSSQTSGAQTGITASAPGGHNLNNHTYSKMILCTKN